MDKPLNREPGDGTEPYAGFQGKIGRTLARSEPWWPPLPTAPRGAPNILIMLVDDMGFSDLGCYGSEIDTPNLDRLAAEGIRFTNFHVTPLCSPTRAALLTGVNPHAAGVGVVGAHTGFPGYTAELAENTATLAEILRANGYATLMVGKWHLCQGTHLSEAGPKHAWPLQRGFERFYGFLDGFTTYHQPRHLVEDNHAVHVDSYPEAYYFTDDITDRAIQMVREVKAANPTKPFFLYFAHGAVHAPLQAKPADIAKYKEAYQAGWDAIRARRHARQQELGVIPPGTALPPRNHEPQHDVQPWDTLSDREKELFARYMAIYAGMVDNVDQNFGRLRAALEGLGEWDNTIVLFLSDNGASREGQEIGTSLYFRVLTHALGREGGLPGLFEADYARLEEMGGPRTYPHYPRGWAMASNTPFRLYKVNTHAGGHQVPFIVSWPARLRSQGGTFRRQYVYVTDVLPTLLELAGVPPLTERAGKPVKPIAGASFAYTLADPAAPSRHTEQYYEMNGHRGYYRDGWEAVTLHLPRTPFRADHWELYDLTADPTETRDLSDERPEKVAELVEAWEEAAWANQVFPLDEGTALRFLRRPPAEAGFSEPVTLYPGTATLESGRSARLVLGRSFTITVRLDFRPGDEGVLVAHGDQGGGYVLYIEEGALGLFYHAFGEARVLRGGAVPAGAQTIVLDAALAGRNRLNVRLLVDGAEVARGEDFPMLGTLTPYEGIDIGIDRRSPVSWELYQRHGTFPYTGVLHSVTYTPGAPAPGGGPELIEQLRQIALQFE